MTDTRNLADADLSDRCAVLGAVADANEDERVLKARDLIRRIAGLPAVERQTWRDDILRAVPTIPKGDFDAIVQEERRAQKEKAKEAATAWAQAAAAERREEAASRGVLLPGPHDPMRVARELAQRIKSTAGVPHLSWWRGDFYRWNSSHWAVQQDATIRKWVYVETEHALYDHQGQIQPWAPNTVKVAHVLDALGTAVLSRTWEADDVKCVAVANGVLDLVPGGRRTLAPHTPKRFNLAALPFDYDPTATCPRWTRFLEEVLPDDLGARQFLREWTGYLVSGRTDLQKIASLVGAKRSGKGTIARVTEALLGPQSVAAPSLSSLAGQFGEQPLIGKSLAVLSDANWGTRDVAEAIEILKKISGEDSRDVARKNRGAWHGKLGVRFMILSNDVPKFADPSGALAGRMIHVRFKKSFFGREDPTLTPTLMTELPGILNWALDGLDALANLGRFDPPASSTDTDSEVQRLSSPVFAFIDDCGKYSDDPRVCVPLDDLFAVYRTWCIDQGIERLSTREVFSRELRSVGNGKIQIKREMVDGVRRQNVYGLVSRDPAGFVARNRWLVGA